MRWLPCRCALAACAIACAHAAHAGEGGATTTPAAVELVGTLVDATSRFAVLRREDRMMSVHVGDEVDGLTIAVIAPGRVEMRSRDGSTQRIVTLGESLARAGETSPQQQPPDDTVFSDPSYTGRIAQGINTDQSLPEHPVRGPTAALPPGAKETRH